MEKVAIIIPSRLKALRLPNKPLELIKGKEMILHVHDLALKAELGEVVVATPDKKIFDLVRNHGGKSFMTSNIHQTGTDRIYEVFEKMFKKEIDIIVNLQGDMPNLDYKCISLLVKYMQKKPCEIATLASKLDNDGETNNENICKVETDKEILINQFDKALDFYRLKAKNKSQFIYHHIGIYAFTNDALMRYVSLNRSKQEIERNLEQLRALENNMEIHVGNINSYPLSVDTKEDLIKIKKIMENDS